MLQFETHPIVSRLLLAIISCPVPVTSCLIHGMGHSMLNIQTGCLVRCQKWDKVVTLGSIQRAGERLCRFGQLCGIHNFMHRAEVKFRSIPLLIVFDSRQRPDAMFRRNWNLLLLHYTSTIPCVVPMH
jgi:hypothetical protein